MTHLTLFELTSLIKSELEKNLEPSYWVIAEISEMRLNPKGHCYMELVDKEGQYVTSKIRANIWAYTYRNLSAWFESITKTSLQPGIKVLLNVQVQYHEQYGMSLNIKDIDPNFTLGERARKRQEVIQKLQDEGIFDINKELTLPIVPQRIAIISSESAAGYGDFKNQIEQNTRGYSFKTKLFQSLMQGDQAPSAMISALHQIHAEIQAFDLVVIIRGGGSQVDLDCFDDYELASHIAQFPLPVITGIGHERDETIADLVAHTQMKTPTAVAEFLISGIERFDDNLNEMAYRLEKSGKHLIQVSAYEIMNVGYSLKASMKAIMHQSENILDQKQLRLNYAVQNLFRVENKKVDNFELPLAKAKNQRLKEAEKKLDGLEKQLKLLDPASVLNRGYSITLINGKPISSVQEVKTGEELETITAKHRIKSTVKSANNE
ncbi:exodeoxyribonuclease VII large subunit [Roseivirga ehrenbergii]|uniref:Exodeoxyribonuclease 7 large subunit n=1 Tax=Roseivirga ehrenbergii (strain DSM 102268 / JCM 13514 / KCTC 12282 / NCIMB 14502 / KMM 6017) TaxID=279360 RepID=A0A150X6P7_ROSEK|nr:exodeoxyribonuclease VII large subunit [Roseivirga ehrenbergii]KYG74383.1 exodeoxyribonuclease VII large subunit [Roseivirga ehrenbergii]TCL14316.1 exodeoxyribonuclease VII large subunit [Roseivirga ehrenbergii]